MIDVHVDIVDGSYHDVDSNELAFKMAAIFAVKDAFKKAKPILLEPIMKVENITPDEYQGDIMGDLNRRRGRISSIETKGNLSTINAEVPLAEMFGYATAIRSLSKGRSSYSMEPPILNRCRPTSSAPSSSNKRARCGNGGRVASAKQASRAPFQFPSLAIAARFWEAYASRMVFGVPPNRVFRRDVGKLHAGTRGDACAPQNEQHARDCNVPFVLRETRAKANALDFHPRSIAPKQTELQQFRSGTALPAAHKFLRVGRRGDPSRAVLHDLRSRY